MTLKIYEYKNCGTCKTAIKFLDENKISYERIPIRETPPSKSEIKKMLGHVGDIKKLFNTSGGDYKELNLKEKLPQLTEEEAINLLASRGNLIKRPFVLSHHDGWVGFNKDTWREKLKKI